MKRVVLMAIVCVSIHGTCFAQSSTGVLPQSKPNLSAKGNNTVTVSRASSESITWDKCIPVIAAFVGGAFGGIVSPLITWKLNERARWLEIYKTYYPAKLSSINLLSEHLKEVVHATHMAHHSKEEFANARTIAFTLYREVLSNRTFLADDVTHTISQFSAKNRTVLDRIEQNGEEIKEQEQLELQTIYLDILTLFNRELHGHRFDALFK